MSCPGLLFAGLEISNLYFALTCMISVIAMGSHEQKEHLMRARVIKIGNSQGLRIPKVILGQTGDDDSVLEDDMALTSYTIGSYSRLTAAGCVLMIFPGSIL